MIVPTPLMQFEMPELPSKNWRAEEVISKRCKDWYEGHPHGYFKVLPSPIEYYEYGNIPKIGKKILYQIIRKSEDSSFLEGNYEEELIFFIGEKDYGWFPFQYFHFEKWWKPVCYEWAAGEEIPIEIMEEATNIPFRENLKYKNKRIKQQYEERRKHEEHMRKKRCKIIF